MCIYFRASDNLKYESREHIFSQAVGGMRRLPQGFVSDQANSLFSKLELIAFRQSFIALNRVVLGPGTKGSVANKMTSSVNIICYDNGDFGLGLLKNLKEHLIPHGYMFDGKLRWGCNAEDGMDCIYQTIIDLKCFDGNVRRLTERAMPKEAMLFGLYEKTLYIGSRDDSISNEKSLRIINEVLKLTENREGVFSTRDNPGKHSFTLLDDNNISRVYGKTAFNVLAHIAGMEYVQNSLFDKFRNWITTGDDKSEFHMLPKIELDNQIIQLLPENSHWCLLSSVNGMLLAVVCYYNSLTKVFCLGNTTDDYFVSPDGYICDWLNKKEYRLIDWITKMPTSKGGIK